MIDLNEAIDVFVHCIAFGRAVYRPCEALRVGTFWLVHDTCSGKGVARSDEWVVPATSTITAIQQAVAEHTGSRAHRLCAAGTDAAVLQELKPQLIGAGYRYRRSEPVMALKTTGYKGRPPLHESIRVQSPAQADALNRATHARQVLPDHLDVSPPAVRAYYSLKQGEVAGFVRCISISPTVSYVAGVETFKQYRRTGIATDLMNAMIADDCTMGLPTSILVASRAGELLYTTLGYHTIGYLHVYSQQRTPMKV